MSLFCKHLWPLLLALSLSFTSIIISAAEPPADDDSETTQNDVKTELLGDYTVVSGLNYITLEGVGLVTGLDGTGGDAPISGARTRLLYEMRRRGVQNPNQILRSPSTALVIVRAYLPPLVKQGDRFDVEVRIPDGSEGTSLRGGRLLECSLFEVHMVPGRGVLQGKPMAKASGPIILTASDSKDPKRAALQLTGTIPGGAISTSKNERTLALDLKYEYQGLRMAKLTADRIGQRFHDFDEYGIRKPLAEAKTDQRIVLKMHQRYRDNYPRYLDVIRHIAFRETPVQKRVRMESLREELLDPETSAEAAISLEAIGPDAITALKSGLKAKTLESRFHSALALSYLGQGDGAEILAEMAKKERAFRVFALAGLANLTGGEGYWQLRELLNESSEELRYGAFRAITVLDPNHHEIHRENMKGQFGFYEIESNGPPLVHLTRTQKTELVLFGNRQAIRTPVSVTAGNHIFVNGKSGSDRVIVSRIRFGEEQRETEVSNELGEIVRAAVELDASYPDVVHMLVQMDQQGNLPGKIAIDALPQAGRTYQRRNGETENQVAVGRQNLTPNGFFLPPTENTKPRESTNQSNQQSRDAGKAPQQASKEGQQTSGKVQQVSGETTSRSGTGPRKLDADSGKETKPTSERSTQKESNWLKRWNPRSSHSSK